MIKTLLKSLGEFKKESILTPIAVVLEVVFESLIPFSIAKLVNNLQTGTDIDFILRSGLEVLVFALISLVLGILAGPWSAKAATGLARNLRRDMFANIQEFSFENINKFSSSSLVTRLTTDTINVQMAYMMIIRGAIRFPINLVFSFVMAYIMGGRMAFIFLFTAPVFALILYVIMKKVTPMFRVVFKKYDNLNKSIQENIKGMRVVKSFVREDFEEGKFDKAAEDLRANFVRAEKIIVYTDPAFQLMLNIAMLFVLSVGSYTVITTRGLDFNVGQMSALLTYSFQIINSLLLLSMIFVMITMSQESARRITEVLEEKTDIYNRENPIMEVKDGSISFDQVYFSYKGNKDNYALTDINLQIDSGQTIGIIGSTGSSKSTLIQLIPRLYDVDKGSVKVGGVDVRDYDLKVLREEVAIVLQNNILFSGSIKDNLRWGKEDASQLEMEEVSKLSQAHGFIEGFEKAYDTQIEQGGANLSGGQKQRVSIARSLIKKPKILILDDSTSAVDTKTDSLIRSGLKDYMLETTKLIIAQRIQSVKDADKILVINEGKIEGFADHDTLMEENSTYREIYESQTRVGDISE